MSYENYSVYDLVMDESFKKGVKHPESEEGLFWEIWTAQHPGKKQEVNMARQIILFMNFETHYLSKADIYTLWEKLNKRIEEREQTVFPKVHTRQRASYPMFSSWYKVAAVFIGLVILSASLFFILQRDTTIQYKTQYGETKKLLLPDSSTVILNANSLLTYSTDLNSKDLRKVWLEGEAFFAVVHTANDQKFIVNTSNLAIEVLGTEFNVNNRRGQTQVVLNTGKVKLNLSREQTDNNPREIFMRPGELVEYWDESHQINKQVVDPERYISWKDNLLIFEDTPVSEIIRILEDNYGLEVILNDSTLVHRKFSATYPADDIDILLRALSKSFRMKISNKDNRVIFEENGQ